MDEKVRRLALLAGGALIGGFAGVRLSSNVPSTAGTTSLVPDGAEGTLNDASGLSQTPVHRHVVLNKNPGEQLVDEVRAYVVPHVLGGGLSFLPDGYTSPLRLRSERRFAGGVVELVYDVG